LASPPRKKGKKKPPTHPKNRWVSPPRVLDVVDRQHPMGLTHDPTADPNGLVLAKRYTSLLPLDRKNRTRLRKLNSLPRGAKLDWQVADALTVPWYGHVYDNPPYSMPAPFLRWVALQMAFKEHYNPELVEVTFLLNSVLGTAYVRDWCWPFASGICILAPPRIAFLDASGKPVQGNDREQVAIYYGPYYERFNRTWSALGECFRVRG